MLRRHESIISLQNPKVKLWSQLLDKKGRDKQGAYLVEGVHLVQEALTWHAPIETLLYSELRGIPAEVQALLDAEDYSFECIPVSEQVLAKCSDAQTPQPVIAVVAKAAHPPEQLLSA
ncbi:MAG: rRNA methyltransferase, partial [Paenibacillus sp.]|nr:rRNA methyltransferase [Paenibacillus sp.]